MSPGNRAPLDRSLADTFIRQAFDAARLHGIGTLIVVADHPLDIQMVEAAREAENVLWLTGLASDHPLAGANNNLVLPVPAVALTRRSQLQLGLLLALLHRQIDLDETVLCLGAREPGRRIETLIAASPKVDLPWFGSHRSAAKTLAEVVSNELARLIAISLRLSAEGREGRPVGTVFVLGQPEELDPYVRQLVLNPCKGHPKRRRDIHDEELFETIREYAALDGAFLVSEKGTVEAAGVYLDAPPTRIDVTRGLGARHRAAASITANTKSVAIAVSGSSGTVTTFFRGKPILTLERPS